MSLIILAALFGVLLAPSLANDNIDIGNEGNVGGNVHQTVNINNQDNVASINSLNGWDSWDSICDYGRGYVAARPFAKKICIVSKMNKDVFPSLHELSTTVKQKQVSRTPTLFKFNVNQVPIANIGKYGVHIEALCKGLPSYEAAVIQGRRLIILSRYSNRVIQFVCGLVAARTYCTVMALILCIEPILSSDNCNTGSIFDLGSISFCF